MKSLTSQQLEPANLPNEVRFKKIDAYVRDFDRKMRDWPTIAKLCKECRDDELWRHSEKPYPGYEAWIKDAMPTCLRTATDAVRLYEALKDDFTFDELKQMPVETARVAEKLPRSVRKNPRVREATTKKRKEFIEAVQEAAPEQHIETEAARTFNFSLTEWQEVEDAIEAMRLIEDDPELSAGKAVAGMATEWLGGEDGIWSRRERYEQIKEYQS